MTADRSVLALCTPLYDSWEFASAAAMQDLIAVFAQANLLDAVADDVKTARDNYHVEFMSWRLKRCLGRGQPASTIRNRLVRMALQGRPPDGALIGTGEAADVILFCDSDVHLTSPVAYLGLAATLRDAPPDVALVGAPCIQQESRGRELILNVNMNGIEGGRDAVSSQRPFECAAIGFGCVAIRAEVFFALEEPWFTFGEARDAEGTMIGEDVGFCDKLRRLGYRIVCDPRIEAVHAFRREFWPQAPDIADLVRLSS